MQPLVVLDPFMFIWDKANFLKDPTQYYVLSKELVDLMELLEQEKPQYILRQELLDEITNSFPACELIDAFPQLYDIITIFYNFIGKISNEIKEYPACTDDVVVEPDICRPFAIVNLREEIQYLVSEVFRDSSHPSFITLSPIWYGDSNIKLRQNGWVKCIQVCFTVQQVQNVLECIKPKFQESPKHKVIGGWDSRLDIIIETVIKLLSQAVETSGESKALYNYSVADNKFIAYRPHEDNVYHAYPIKSNEIPGDVRKILVELIDFKGKRNKVLKGQL